MVYMISPLLLKTSVSAISCLILICHQILLQGNLGNVVFSLSASTPKGGILRRSGNRCGVSIEYTVSNTENKWVWHNMELVFMQLKVQIRLTSLQSLTLNHYTTLPAHQDVPYFQMQLFWKLVDFNRKNLPDNKWLENENKQTKTHRHYLSFFKKWLAFYSN